MTNETACTYQTHDTFGGYVYLQDFDTNYKKSNSIPWTSRILADRRFDEQCKKNAENRENAKKEAG